MRHLVFPVVIFGLASPARANVVGSDNQNFNPQVSSTDYVTVHATDTLTPGRIRAAVFANQAVNTLPYRSGEHQSRSSANDTLLGLDVGLAIGVLPRLELGLTAPFMLSQTVDADDTRGEFDQRGNTEIRGFAKWAFLKRDQFGLGAVSSLNINRTRDNPTTGNGAGRVSNLELVSDLSIGKLTLAANVGYRWRERAEPLEGSLIAPLGNQAIASLAMSYALTQRSGLVVESYGAKVVQATDNATDRALASAESLIGFRHAFSDALMAHIGAGTELNHGLSTPDWRFYAGIVTEAGPSGQGKTVVKKSKKKHRQTREPSPTPEIASEDDFVTPVSELPTEAPDEVFILRNIEFEFDSDYRVLQGAIAELDKLHHHLGKRPFDQLVVEGHTDYFGTDSYNEDLSLRRARVVRRALIKRYGYEPEKIKIVGYGERVPLASAKDDTARQTNRRVEIKIYRDYSH